MTDVRTMYDKEWLYAYDLGGKDLTIKIVSVSQMKLVGEGGKTNKKAGIRFKTKDGVLDDKKLPLPITNSKTIAAMYGWDDAGWIGKYITIYPTTTTFGSATRDCIRVRPTIPKVSGGNSRPTAPDLPTDDGSREPGSDDR